MITVMNPHTNHSTTHNSSHFEPFPSNASIPFNSTKEDDDEINIDEHNEHIENQNNLQNTESLLPNPLPLQGKQPKRHRRPPHEWKYKH